MENFLRYFLDLVILHNYDINLHLRNDSKNDSKNSITNPQPIFTTIRKYV